MLSALAEKLKVESFYSLGVSMGRQCNEIII
jgi:hypothetical protein